MYKFVIMNNGTGYEKYTLMAAAKDGAVVSELPSLPFKKIHNFINAYRINKHVNMPFKKLWYKHYFDESNLSPTDKVCFVFWESLNITYSKDYLLYLHRKYPHSKFVYFFSNPINDYNYEKYNYVDFLFDIALLTSPEDIKRKNFYYSYMDFLLFPDLLPDTTYESDIFFVGANKGRLTLLLDIYKNLNAQGLKCRFFITGVKEEEKKYEEDIIYNQYMQYEEVLKYVRNTKCVLEIIQQNGNYPSYRILESIKYNKKLLTTNEKISEHSLYNSRAMRAFSSASEIDKDFILSDISDLKRSVFSFNDFATFVTNLLDK